MTQNRSALGCMFSCGDSAHEILARSSPCCLVAYRRISALASACQRTVVADDVGLQEALGHFLLVNDSKQHVGISTGISVTINCRDVIV